jgi:1,4-alpha-glucan branching enzyme
MGTEIAQGREWNHDSSVEWHLLDYPLHRGAQTLVRDLNGLYCSRPALHALDCEPDGFEWIEASDSDNSTLVFLRRSRDPETVLVAACNFTPIPRHGYRIGVPLPGRYREVLNTDADIYGGSNLGNAGGCLAEPLTWHGRPFSLSLTLPPLATLYFERTAA